MTSYYDDELTGISFKKFAKKALKVANPITHAKALVKLSDPRTHLKIARDIIRNPRNIKRNIGKLAMVDPGIAAGAAVFRDLKSKGAKPKAVRAYKQAVVKAEAGDATAKKVVGTVKQLARSEIEAPESNDDRELLPEVASQAVDADEGSEVQAEEEPLEDADSIEGDTMLGGLVTVGFSFGNILKSVTKAVKAVGPAAMAVAKMTPYGAAISTATNLVSKAAPGLAKGMGLMEKAKQGDPAAQGKIAQVQALAKAGNPEGEKALATLQQAREVHNAAVIASATPATTAPTPIAVPGQPVTVNIHLAPGQRGYAESPQGSFGSLYAAGLK